MKRLNFHRLVLIIILLLAFVLRVGWPGLTEYKFDEAVTLRRAMALATAGVIPRGTISSVAGIPQPPLKAYIEALPLIIAPDPRLAVIWLGLLGVGAVGLTYLIGQRYFNATVGLIAAAGMAAAPWVVFFDRKLWALNVPILTLGFMFALYELIVGRRFKAAAGLLTAFVALTGVYTGGVVFGAVLAVALILHIRQIRDAFKGEMAGRQAMWLGIGVLGAGLLTAIIIGPDLEAWGGISFDGTGASDPGGEAIRAPLVRLRYLGQVASGFQYHALAGEHWLDYYDSLPLGGPAIDGALNGSWMVVMVLGVLYVAVKAVLVTRRESGQAAAPYTLLALWQLTPILIWTATGLAPQIHRYVQHVPGPQLAGAILLVDGSTWISNSLQSNKDVRDGLQRRMLLTVGGMLTVLLLWQSVMVVGMLRYVRVHGADTPHGVPGAAIWTAARTIRAESKDGALPVVIQTRGDDPETEGGAAEWDAALYDLDPILIEGTMMQVWPPAKEWLFVAETGDLWNVHMERRMDARPDTQPDGAARFANGIDLLTVETASRPAPQMVQPGESFLVRLAWRVWSLPEAREQYSYTVRLLTDGERTVAQQDGNFLRREYWQEGQWVVTVVEMQVADDAPAATDYDVMVGMYVYLSISEQRGIDILDVAGNPAGQSVTVPLDGEE